MVQHNRYYGLEVVTAATTMPVSLSNVKEQLAVTTTDHDALITRMIEWATDKFQTDTSRQLINATFAAHWDAFPDSDEIPLRLPRVPCSTASSETVITYVNTSAGTTSTWSSSEYKVDPYSQPPRILPAYNVSFPTARDEINAVKVQFVAGYGTSTSNTIPALAVECIHKCVAEQYRHREVGAWDSFAEDGWQNLISRLKWEL